MNKKPRREISDVHGRDVEQSRLGYYFLRALLLILKPRWLQVRSGLNVRKKNMASGLNLAVQPGM